MDLAGKVATAVEPAGKAATAIDPAVEAIKKGWADGAVPAGQGHAPNSTRRRAMSDDAGEGRSEKKRRGALLGAGTGREEVAGARERGRTAAGHKCAERGAAAPVMPC